ncbi:MAG TPA: hypothetical protein PKE65_03225 [Rhizobiaceae bacterium]|nr:hypothetical protein [Rhizobiaceae bacterium]
MKDQPDNPHTFAATRKERLAAELRRNLARRKTQARARRSGEDDRRPAGAEFAQGGEMTDSIDAATGAGIANDAED